MGEIIGSLSLKAHRWTDCERCWRWGMFSHLRSCEKWSKMPLCAWSCNRILTFWKALLSSVKKKRERNAQKLRTFQAAQFCSACCSTALTFHRKQHTNPLLMVGISEINRMHKKKKNLISEKEINSFFFFTQKRKKILLQFSAAPWSYFVKSSLQ